MKGRNLMANKTKTIAFIKKVEGGWSDVITDKGGATYCGITLATYQQYFGKNKTKYDLRNISNDEWLHIFNVGYWNPWKADQIKNDSIALLCVDMGFNSGVKNAIKRVQTALGCNADGIVGPKTLAALNATPSYEVFYKIWRMRCKYYVSLAGSGNQLSNLRGWINRILSIPFEY